MVKYFKSRLIYFHQPGVTLLKIGDICYRVSEASEILLGVDN